MNSEMLDLFPTEESSPEDSRAKTSASQDVARAWLANDPASSGTSSGSWMNSIPVGSCSRTSLASCHQREGGIWESSSGRWGTAGMGSPTECWTLSTSEYPSDGGASSSSLADVLESPTVPGLFKYFLSPKAAQGILRRAGRRGRSLPEPLETALQAVASSTPSPETDSVGGGPDDNLAQAGHLIPQRPSTPVAIQVDSEPSRESISSSYKNATREREREISAAGKQQQDAISGEHDNYRDGAKDGPRYRISGDNVMNTISASIYHHGTVVNQDLMSGHLVIVDE